MGHCWRVQIHRDNSNRHRQHPQVGTRRVGRGGVFHARGRHCLVRQRQEAKPLDNEGTVMIWIMMPHVFAHVLSTLQWLLNPHHWRANKAQYCMSPINHSTVCLSIIINEEQYSYIMKMSLSFTGRIDWTLPAAKKVHYWLCLQTKIWGILIRFFFPVTI